MKKGIDPEHFSGMRKSRTRGVALKGDLDGARASKRVWTCTHCTHEVHVSPYASPHTRAKPRKCQGCKSVSWVFSASKSEANRYAELRQRKDVHFLWHPPKTFALHVPICTGGLEKIRTYTADFSYYLETHDTRLVFEDHKPHNRLPDLTKLIHNWVLVEHGIDVLVTWYTGRGKSKRISQAWSSELR